MARFNHSFSDPDLVTDPDTNHCTDIYIDVTNQETGDITKIYLSENDVKAMAKHYGLLDQPKPS